MPAPAFVQASSGFAFTTGSGNVATLAGTTATNLLLIHVVEDGFSLDWNIGGYANIENLNGTDNDAGFLWVDSNVGGLPSAGHTLLIARSLGGTAQWTLDVGASGNDLFTRMYEFSGVITTTTTNDTTCENGATPVPDFSHTNAGDGISISGVAVTSNGDNRLAVQIIGINNNRTFSPLTGWDEPVVEFNSATGTAATLGINTFSMPSATTKAGGTTTMTSAAWGVFGFALIGTPDLAPTSPIFRIGRGSAW